MLDALLRAPHAMGEPFRDSAQPDAPVYHRELSLPPAATGADSLRIEGVDAPALHTASKPVVGATPRWFDGAWEVVFTRDLRPDLVGEVQLAPGRGVQIAVAVWNGAAGDARGQKSVSIWHALELAP
jgi:DMSO reductase family type II enzyme heme b subunit